VAAYYEPTGRRWLLKAVREGAGELFSLFFGLSERALVWRPAEDEWCLKEVAAHLRDADTLYRKQIELMVRQRDPDLPYEAIDCLPAERDYRSQPLNRFLREFETSREETVWMLRLLDESDWERCGRHPYRGRTTVQDVVREVHEHDLEHLWQVRRLRDLLAERGVV
jgi:hypothetical protein